MAASAEDVVRTLLSAFPDANVHPEPEQVEAVMRQFGVISYETEREINKLLLTKKRSPTGLGIKCWMEANFVVAGSGAMLEQRIQFLLMDTCTCVLEHLPKAIEHAPGRVDQRILNLLK